MLSVPEKLESAGLSAQMLLQVHDELVLECQVNELAATALVVSREMDNAYKLSVPLKTDARSGPNWYMMEDIQLLD